MGKFTEIEEKLMKCINDDQLLLSLATIRKSSEKIWAIDAPRIIHDFTDHSIKHSERLIDYADKLLLTNTGRYLSSQETYLLLVGIYIHDIGMQCDIVKYPGIQARAEELGAKFDLEFNAKTASMYNIDEQMAIRKNHQYLSAAWIDYSFRTGETVLGQAAKTIPSDLVADLMDVCMFHSQLPITNCSLTFQFNPSERKQLIAALLRLSDELDIDSCRVTIETVMNFRLDPYSALYWWLHNQTKIIFISNNVILLTIQLNPKDVSKYGTIIHDNYIKKFQKKNQAVLSILNQNDIPIAISSDSDVVSNDHIKQLPRDVIEILQGMQVMQDSLTEFASEVRTWLQAVRYNVTKPKNRDERTLQMLATLEHGMLKQQVLVHCIGGEIEADDVDILDELLDRKTPQGWLICDKRVSDQARKKKRR